jgi:hypothetical protein
MMAVRLVIEWIGCEVAVVIDTKVGCAAGGWMDVDGGGREERKKRRGEGRVLISLGAGSREVVCSPWQLVG